MFWLFRKTFFSREFRFQGQFLLLIQTKFKEIAITQAQRIKILIISKEKSRIRLICYTTIQFLQKIQNFNPCPMTFDPKETEKSTTDFNFPAIHHFNIK